MGDANVRRPVATRFEHGVDFGLLVHKSPFMADKRDPLVLSNYSTSRWGAFLRSVTPHMRPGDYQHAACRILNGIAKRIETTLQALPPGTPGKAQAFAALQALKQALKDETSGIPLRERLPSASRATEKFFRSYKHQIFPNLPPLPKAICGLPQRACSHSEDPRWTSVMGCSLCMSW